MSTRAAVLAIAAASGIALATAYWLSTRRKKSVSIAELWIFPVKGCKGNQVSRAVVTRRGLQHDRLFMVVKPKPVPGKEAGEVENKFISQRSHPKMVLITTRIDEAAGELILTASHMETEPELRVPLASQGGRPMIVTVWSDVCEAEDCGEEAAAWFSRVLTRSSEDQNGSNKAEMENLRLVRMSDSFDRKTDPKYASDGVSAFSDGYPFSLSSQEGLDLLNSNLQKRGVSPVTNEHFRTNIIVQGCAPFEEDKWKQISISCPNQQGGLTTGTEASSVSFRIVKFCARCKVPTNDPQSGVLNPNNEPTKTLATFRTGDDLGLGKWHKDVFFSQNLVFDEAGSSSLDSRIELSVGLVASVK